MVGGCCINCSSDSTKGFSSSNKSSNKLFNFVTFLSCKTYFAWYAKFSNGFLSRNKTNLDNLYIILRFYPFDNTTIANLIENFSTILCHWNNYCLMFRVNRFKHVYMYKIRLNKMCKIQLFMFDKTKDINKTKDLKGLLKNCKH